VSGVRYRVLPASDPFYPDGSRLMFQHTKTSPPSMHVLEGTFEVEPVLRTPPDSIFALRITEIDLRGGPHVLRGEGDLGFISASRLESVDPLSVAFALPIVRDSLEVTFEFSGINPLDTFTTEFPPRFFGISVRAVSPGSGLGPRYGLTIFAEPAER
jgi:hypothetical protein